MTVYFISGLGADERIFKKLQLPAHVQVRYLSWLMPLQKETLLLYCHRMAAPIDTSEAFTLIGLSFGGMIATEIAKFLQPKLVILISSIATKDELPPAFKMIARFRLDKAIPARFFNNVYPFTYWYFGVKNNDEKKLLREYIKTASPHYLQWSISQIVGWKNTVIPPNLVHIHGTSDHVFPVAKTKADVKVKGGGHLMVYSKADVISNIVTQYLT